jgi:riboflavin synthase alpha subunit
VDGTSLTVCDSDAATGRFTFMLIPYTQKHIIVPRKAVGDRCGACGLVGVYAATTVQP